MNRCEWCQKYGTDLMPFREGGRVWNICDKHPEYNMPRFDIPVQFTAKELWEYEEYAESHGVKLSEYIKRLVLTHGKPKLPNRRGKAHKKDLPLDEIRELRKLNHSWGEIGKRYGVDSRTIRARLDEEGI